jgi:uncharacterized Zn-finger protein
MGIIPANAATDGWPMERSPAQMPIPVPETEIVSTWKVACDGGEGALGHPRVWLAIPEDMGWVECGYCDKRFVHESAADKAAG